MEEDRKYWLDKHGNRYWYKNSDISITANRAYHWVDRVIFIKESKVIWAEPSKLIPYGHYTTTERKFHGDEMTYTKFKEEINDWTPIENFDDYIKLLKFEYEVRKYNI